MNAADRFRVLTLVQDYIFEDNVVLSEGLRLLQLRAMRQHAELSSQDATIRRLRLELQTERSTVELLSNAVVDHAVRADNNAVALDLVLDEYPEILPFVRTVRRRLQYDTDEPVDSDPDDSE